MNYVKEEVQLFIFTKKMEIILGNQEDTKELVPGLLDPNTTHEITEMYARWFDQRYARLKESKETLIAFMVQAKLPYKRIQKLLQVSPNTVSRFSKAKLPDVRTMEGFERLADCVADLQERLESEGFEGGLEQ